MNPDIFIKDFELTKNTEELHAILGRCLVISTRFDNLCDVVAKFLELKKASPMSLSENDFNNFIKSMLDKFSILNNNINSLPVRQEAKDILHIARKDRNAIAHSLSIGMTGCLDINVDENDFKSQVSSLIMNIATGDYLISAMLSVLTNEPLPNYTEDYYKQKITRWVLGNN